jgi:hypothetical protein
MISTLPPGTLGFDCNTPVSQVVAHKFVSAGYRFIVRYVPRVTRASHDLSAAELMNLLLGGLGVMVVQHVSGAGWQASGVLGASYGITAAKEAHLCGYPAGATLWCDLEEVGNTGLSVIEFCNEWYKQVKDAGYEPGLYVGYKCGLTAVELYRKLHFQRYWSAYNLNTDHIPIVRGVQMKQHAYPPPSDRVGEVSFEYDENVILVDKLAGTPTLLLP